MTWRAPRSWVSGWVGWVVGGLSHGGGCGHSVQLAWGAAPLLSGCCRARRAGHGCRLHPRACRSGAACCWAPRPGRGTAVRDRRAGRCRGARQLGAHPCSAKFLWRRRVRRDHHHVVPCLAEALYKAFESVLHAADVTEGAGLHENGDFALAIGPQAGQRPGRQRGGICAHIAPRWEPRRGAGPRQRPGLPAGLHVCCRSGSGAALSDLQGAFGHGQFPGRAGRTPHGWGWQIGAGESRIFSRVTGGPVTGGPLGAWHHPLGCNGYMWGFTGPAVPHMRAGRLGLELPTRAARVLAI